MRLVLLAVLSLVASGAGAQTATRNAADAAKAFSLDLPPAPAETPTTDTPPRPSAADPDAAAAPPTAVFTLDTPIAQLVADPRAKAVLDRDMPGLSDDGNLPKFQSYSLRQFQPMTGGQLTDALLAKTGADLAALGGAAPAPFVPAATMTAPTTAHDKRLDGGR